MCYGKFGCKFNWIFSYCKVMFVNMVVLLIKYEQIVMILLKVKEMKLIIDKFIILGKCGDFYVCCQVILQICDMVMVVKLFEIFGEWYKDC